MYISTTYFKISNALRHLILICGLFSCSTSYGIKNRTINFEKEFQKLVTLQFQNSDSTLEAVNTKIIKCDPVKDIQLLILYHLFKAEVFYTDKNLVRLKFQLQKLKELKGETHDPFVKHLIKFFQIRLDIDHYSKTKFDRIVNRLKVAADKSNLPYLIALINRFHGSQLLMHFSSYEEGLNKLKLAEKQYRTLKDSNQIYATKYYIAYYYFTQNNIAAAMSIFQECTDFSKRKNQLVMRLFYQEKVVYMAYYSGDFEKGKSLSLDILSYAKKLPRNGTIENMNSFMSNLYLKENQIDSSYYYLKQQLEIDLQKRNQNKHSLAAEIEDSFDKENKKNIMKFKERELIRFHKTNQIILGYLFICALMIAFTYYAYRGKKKISKILKEQHTYIKKQNNQIQNALNEKTLLLQEIHHRVKNNLQIVSSLLNLQSRGVENAQLLNIFNEGKERIQTIALVHQKLYQSKTFSSIDVEDYVNDLISQLKRTYPKESENFEIQLQIQNLYLNTHSIIPLGLIICELMSKTIRSQKKDSKKNLELKITSSSAKDIFILKIIAEDVVFNVENDNLDLGSEIICALTEQIDGVLIFQQLENAILIELKFKQTDN